MKVCKVCRVENEEKFTYCKNCGTLLDFPPRVEENAMGAAGSRQVLFAAWVPYLDGAVIRYRMAYLPKNQFEAAVAQGRAFPVATGQPAGQNASAAAKQASPIKPKYTILLWDLDNTLLDFGRSEAQAITRTLSERGIPCSEREVHLYSAANDRYWKAYERGEIPKEEIYEGRFREFFREIGRPEENISEVAAAYASYLGEYADKMPYCDEILDYCAGKYQMYVVSNGLARNQAKRMALSGIDQKVAGSFVSEQIGYGKPDPRYFEAVFAAIPEKEKSRILLIGDSLTSDIAGGNAAGVDTCFVNPENVPQTQPSTYTVRSLLELKKIL